jgi:kinetochore protein NDC80
VRTIVNRIRLPSVDGDLATRYREQVEKVARLRDETVRAIVKNSTEIAMFKEEISRQLKSLRDFAESGQ